MRVTGRANVHLMSQDAPDVPGDGPVPESQVPESQVPESQVPDSRPADDGAGPAVPQTGDPTVDEALARLAGAADLPLEEQVGVFDAVHRTLQDRLADVDG